MGIWYEYDRTNPFAPFVSGLNPSADKTNVSVSSLISFNLLNNPKQEVIKIYVKGDLAYDGYVDQFYSPYNNTGSSISPVNIDGYDGYAIVLDSSEGLYNINTIFIDTEFIQYTYTVSQYIRWAFLVGTDVNVLYFSDGYGLKAIDVQDFVGESQDAVRLVLSESTSPMINQNEIGFIHGKRIDGYSYLALSSVEVDFGSKWGSFLWGADTWGRYVLSIADTLLGWGLTVWGDIWGASEEESGVTIVENEVGINEYLDGYHVKQAQLTEDGTLYVINRDYNQINVFYGAHFRDGPREPDYIYDQYSAPPIMEGTITCLHIVDNNSLVHNGSTRLYVGTTNGMTRVDTWDQSVDGYSLGFEYCGRSFNYGIEGSGFEYDVIGGTIDNVVAISSDEQYNIVLVATHDGYGNGGLSQIKLDGNRLILFMDEDSIIPIPSVDIRNIFGKGY